MRRAPTADWAVAIRRDALDKTWTVERRGRIELVVDLVEGKRVLHLGCVDHSVASFEGSEWLHAHLLRASSSCVGVDMDEEGVEAMRSRGMEAYVADINEAPPPELRRIPKFDWVVAGELIEHLPAPQSLLTFAQAVLAPRGRLLVMTPNPYAPWRVMRGQTRRTWENIDHIMYVFPSGIAEMAARTNMRLEIATTVNHHAFREVAKSALLHPLRRFAHRLRLQGEGDLPWNYVSVFETATFLARKRHGWLGETAVYVLVPETVDAASLDEAPRAV